MPEAFSRYVAYYYITNFVLMIDRTRIGYYIIFRPRNGLHYGVRYQQSRNSRRRGRPSVMMRSIFSIEMPYRTGSIS